MIRNSFEICIIMFLILFAGKHEKMATYPSKVSLCLIALFAILFLARATSGNKTNQPSNNMVGDTETASDKSDKIYVNFWWCTWKLGALNKQSKFKYHWSTVLPVYAANETSKTKSVYFSWNAKSYFYGVMSVRKIFWCAALAYKRENCDSCSI